jgi:hypothetical protein
LVYYFGEENAVPYKRILDAKVGELYASKVAVSRLLGKNGAKTLGLGIKPELMNKTAKFMTQLAGVDPGLEWDEGPPQMLSVYFTS